MQKVHTGFPAMMNVKNDLSLIKEDNLSVEEEIQRRREALHINGELN